MRLLQTLRAFDIKEKEVDQIRDQLVDAAEAFLRAGGQISLAEWNELTNDSKMALVDGGNRILHDLALMIGRAGLDPIYSTSDNGENMDEILMDEVVERTALKLEK